MVAKGKLSAGATDRIVSSTGSEVACMAVKGMDSKGAPDQIVSSTNIRRRVVDER